MYTQILIFGVKANHLATLKGINCCRQTGQFFAYWAMVFFGKSFITEVALIFGLFFLSIHVLPTF
jgi:hypothetical protein